MTFFRNIARRMLPASVWQRLDQSSLGKRLVGGMFWNLSSSVLTRIFTLAGAVAIARMLGKEEFGKYGLLQQTTLMFTSFAGLGMTMTAAKYVAEFRTTDPARTSRIIRMSSIFSLVTSMVVAVCIMLLSARLANDVLHAPELKWLLVVVSLSVVFSAWAGAQNGVLSGFEAFRALAVRNTLVATLGIGGGVVGAWLGGLAGAVWAISLAAVLNCIANSYLLQSEMRRHGIPSAGRGSFAEWRAMVHFSLPVFVAGIIYMPTNWACSAMLANEPHGFSELGIFNATVHWRAVILFLPGALGGVMIPLLSNVVAEKRYQQAAKLLWVTIVWTFSASVVVALPIIVLSRPIMRIYGQGYTSDGTALILMAVLGIMMAVTTILWEILVGMGRSKTGLVFVIGYGAISLGSVWGLRTMGVNGLLLGLICGQVFQMIAEAVAVIGLFRGLVKQARQ